MSLEVGEGTSFRTVAPGTYVARCIRLIDLGTQHGEYQGKSIVRKQVIVTWELPTELIEDGEYAGQPYIISRFYTASLGEKANLRKDLEAWRGRAFNADELKGFNLRNILDKTCMISIVHSEKGKAQVGAVMALMKGTEIPERMNPIICFDISKWDEKVFQPLSDGIKKMIINSDEYKFSGNDVIDNPASDDIKDLEPF